jgi:uncharacterized membrane protein YphA (DoxX/SURF4 family)
VRERNGLPMNERMGNPAIPCLRWCVGLIVLWGSWRFAFGESAMREFAHTGLPAWIRPALGGVEIVAAVLFLLPVTSVVGGYALLGIFLFAAALHVMHRWYDISSLMLYAMAVWVSLAHSAEVRGVPKGELP